MSAMCALASALAVMVAALPCREKGKRDLEAVCAADL